MISFFMIQSESISSGKIGPRLEYFKAYIIAAKTLADTWTIVALWWGTSLRDVSMSSKDPVHHFPYLGDIIKTPSSSFPDMISSFNTRSFFRKSGQPSAWYSWSDAIATSGNIYA
ncbi:hypothetical protein PBCV1_a238L [Paramecium bursaria Chlorella virus 1]|uniref:Uncharacterized protein n=1 Tax=Paramecium bursaria Chlorella virus 1 TaxID=10506 RepID=Q84558_PBCV1|nr:hypothetical protein PBCV1_a238L [Paramecium bursaria Chlorella virus 1]AAC96606.1 hypothetical protein [Paramecium bursaria Chlorella virus 1]